MAYPPSVPPNSRANLTAMDTSHPSDHNTISNALTDIINELGSTPKGASATLSARLTAIEANGWVTSARIQDATIVTGDLADSAVTSAKIADATIVTGDLADGAVTSAKIADGTIVAGDIANATLTGAKMADEAFSGFGPLSSGIAVGTGAASGRYFKLGNLVFFHIDIELGTGFSVSAPVLQIPSASFNNGSVGSWQHTYDIRYYDASAATWWGGKGVWVSASTFKLTYLVSFGGLIYADVSATAPFTWAVGDRIMLSGWYEEA